MALKDRIRQRMDELAMTQAELARATKKTPAIVSLWLKGSVTNLSADSLLQLSKALMVSTEWLTGREPQGISVRAIDQNDPSELPDGYCMIPMLEVTFSAGDGDETDDNDIEQTYIPFSLEQLREWGVRPENAVAYKAKGDSMFPTICDRDGIVVDRSEREIAYITEGAVYAINNNGDLRVKRIRKKFNGNLVLISDNPIYDPEEIPVQELENFKLIGRVKGRMGRGDI